MMTKTDGDGGVPRCRFFIQGRCRHGAACRFRHDDDDERAGTRGVASSSAVDGGEHTRNTVPLCRFYQYGHCRYGDQCFYRHDGSSSTDNTNITTGEAAAASEEEPLVCGICLEDVTAHRKHFGLLEGCDHVFCYDCLMQWRTSKEHHDDDRRDCPACRTASSYIVPSLHFAAAGAVKDAIVARFKARRAVQPCQHWDGTLGSCPFGRDCFYQHHDADGNDTKALDESMQELHDRRVAQRCRRRRARGSDAPLDESLDYLAIQLALLRTSLGRRWAFDADEYEDDDVFAEEIVRAHLDALSLRARPRRHR